LKFSLERLNELEVLREDDRGYQTVLVTDETDPYVDHWWPPGHVIGWEHTFVHENYEFLSAVAEGGEFEPSFEQGTRCKNSSTRSNAPTSAGVGVGGVAPAERFQTPVAPSGSRPELPSIAESSPLYVPSVSYVSNATGSQTTSRFSFPGGVGYGHPIARLHDAVAGPRAELHRLVRVLAADVQLFGRNWFGTGRDDHEVCPSVSTSNSASGAQRRRSARKTAAPTSANSTTTMPTSIPEPAIGVNPVRRSGTRTFAFPSARGGIRLYAPSIRRDNGGLLRVCSGDDTNRNPVIPPVRRALVTSWIADPEGGRARGPRALARAWIEALVRPRRLFANGVAPGDQAPALTFAVAVAAAYALGWIVSEPGSSPKSSCPFPSLRRFCSSSWSCWSRRWGST